MARCDILLGLVVSKSKSSPFPSGRIVTVDLPCGRCGTNLRGHRTDGQCNECGLGVSKSLTVSALRSEYDPLWMDSVASGMTAQAWGMLLGLLACVVGPLFLSERVSAPAFALVVVVLMSVVGLWRIYGPHAKVRPERALLSSLLIPVGSAAVVVPSMLVHFELSRQANIAVLAALLGSGTCWFLGECSRLRLLEDLAHALPGRDLGLRAKHVRWGSYGVLLLIAIGVGQAIWDGGRLGLALPQLSGSFIVMTSVALMILTLLSSLLCGRISQLARDQAEYVRAFAPTAVDLPQRPRRFEVPLPDEPDWVIG